MKRTLFVAAAVIGLGAVVALGLWLVLQPKPATEITLFGNIDLRQVELAFNDSERVAAVLVSEGDRVVTRSGVGAAGHGSAGPAGRPGGRPGRGATTGGRQVTSRLPA